MQNHKVHKKGPTGPKMTTRTIPFLLHPLS